MNKIILLFALSLSGCIISEIEYPMKNIWIIYSKDQSVYVKWGVSKELKELDSFKIVQIHFTEARGSQKRILGLKVKETTDAYETNRLFFSDNKNLKKSYSINDILTFKTEKIDTMTVYIVPD